MDLSCRSNWGHQISVSLLECDHAHNINIALEQDGQTGTLEASFLNKYVWQHAGNFKFLIKYVWQNTDNFHLDEYSEEKNAATADIHQHRHSVNLDIIQK